MEYSITFGNGINFNSSPKIQRTQKGKSVIDFPHSFVVVDLETTGLDPYFDEIIEMSAIKVNDGVVVETFSQLVKPEFEIDDFITDLTGITNEMLANAPIINEVFPAFLNFVGTHVIVCHNVNFDVNFIYDNTLSLYDLPFTNDFIDTMRLSRKLLPELKHHRLNDLVKFYNLSPRKEHRALNDCRLTLEIFNLLCATALEQYENISSFQETFKKKSQKLKASDIVATSFEFDESHPLYGKTVVFTGALDNLLRKDAMQLVVNVGGNCADTVTKKTDYLVFGNTFYNLKGEKSSKRIKAEKMILQGYSIKILSENTFYDLLEIDER